MDQTTVSYKDICAYNYANTQKEETGICALREQAETITAEELKKHLCAYHWPEEERFDDLGTKIDEAYAHQLEKALNLTAIPPSVEVQYAVCVKNTGLRLFPSMSGSYRAGQTDIDRFAISRVNIGEKVICRHIDDSGEWRFVQTKNARGWIKNEALALTEREVWR